MQNYAKTLIQGFFWTFIWKFLLPLSYRENGQFYDTPPFCLLVEKYLLVDVVDFRRHDQDFASIRAE